MGDTAAARVVATTEAHIEGVRSVLDCVAREGRYLAFLEAPPVERMRKFILDNIASGNPQFVAVDHNEVVGWCDIVRSTIATQRHCGVLGMGLMPAFRARGIGRALAGEAIDAAWARGFLRIELGVRESNAPAIALYRKMGFEIEGIRRKASCVDGRYEDSLVMGLLRP